MYNKLSSTTKAPLISYSIHNLQELNLKINNKNPGELNYFPNEFISEYMVNNITKRKGEIIREYRKLEPRNDFIQFNLLNDTRFGLPKVYVNLFFFHPFMRPNITKDFDNDNYFFSIITYLSFINREINLNLTDAIRAGNTFNVYYSESFFFIDIFAYSDKIKKILEIIKKIIFSNKNEIFNKNNFAIYRDNALEDFSDIDRANITLKLNYNFIKYNFS